VCKLGWGKNQFEFLYIAIDIIIYILNLYFDHCIDINWHHILNCMSYCTSSFAECS